MKKCNVCNTNKPLTEFYASNKTKADGTPYIYYNPECKECTKKRSTKFIKDNPEKFKGYMKKENSKPHRKILIGEISKEFRESGKYLEWQRNNPDKMTEYRLNRQHKNHDITKEEWENCKEYFGYECAYCGLHISEHFNKFYGELRWSDLHKEHVEHDGANDITNCIPSCKVCNSSKKTSTLENWYTLNNPNYSEKRLNLIYKWLFEDVYNIA